MPNLILVAVTLVIYILVLGDWFFFLTEPPQAVCEVCQSDSLSFHKVNENEVADDVKNDIDKKNDGKCVHCVSYFECFYYIIRQIYKKVSLRSNFF